MTRSAQPLQSSEGRSTYATPETSWFPANFDDTIPISFTHEREALIKVVLIGVSLHFNDGIMT